MLKNYFIDKKIIKRDVDERFNAKIAKKNNSLKEKRARRKKSKKKDERIKEEWPLWFISFRLLRFKNLKSCKFKLVLHLI